MRWGLLRRRLAQRDDDARIAHGTLRRAAAIGAVAAEVAAGDAKIAEAIKNAEAMVAEANKNAEKAVAAAQKDIPQRDKNLEEIAKSYAELTPQVEPMKAKVKASQEQYFAMLPKREVAKK